MDRNIVLIVLDTVRKDYFEEYAKSIKNLSSSSFNQCRAASSWSLPSHASMFSGKLPSQHHIHSESFSSDFDFSENMSGETIFDLLEDYYKIGISSNIYINEDFGVDRLFDEFHNHSIGSHWHSVPFPEGLTTFGISNQANKSLFERYKDGCRNLLSHNRPVLSLINGLWLLSKGRIEGSPLPRLTDDGAKTNAKTAIEAAKNDDGPFFMFLNFMDAHNPLQNSIRYNQSLHSVPNSWTSNELDKWGLLIDDLADEEYTQNYRSLYGASIDYLDNIISDMITSIKEITSKETTFIVTADHGHNLGYSYEEGHFHHTTSMTEGILHVPLEIINPPHDFPSTVDEYFSHVNLPKLIYHLSQDSFNDEIIDDSNVVSETIGLLGESQSIDYPNATKDDEKYWNRMIRCGYIEEIKYEWDSLNRSKKYKLKYDKPCWQDLIECEVKIPNQILSKFDVETNEYKSDWESKQQDLSFDTDVKRNLKDLGYL